MRITNTMITNQTMSNVAKSKRNLAELENQLSTEKAITRPSDDPIVAIRALSLRSSLAEINQYLEHNIPDAESWYEITEGALEDMDAIFTDIYQLCNQGASDQFTEKDRNAIVEVLKQYKEAVYSECNTSFSDRYIFSGYKTDTAFTFLTDEDASKTYRIDQTFSPDEFQTARYMKNSVDETTISSIATADFPETENFYKLNMAYSGLTNANPTVSYNATTDASGNTTYSDSVTATGCSLKEFEAMVTAGTVDENSAYFLYDTGELVFGTELYKSVKNTNELAITYEKEGFTKGEVRPEMYFDCEDITDSANTIPYTHRKDESIEYTINFSQSIRVNTRGCDTLSYNIGRDIDNLCNALTAVADVEDKITKLTEMSESSAYTDAEKKEIATMLEAANQEYDYALDYMESLFSKELTKVKGYQEVVDLQLADLGARETKLSLTKSRITEQQTTFKDLKSKNEDVNLEDAVIGYSSASTLYQAALTAASDVVKQSLLDYI